MAKYYSWEEYFIPGTEVLRNKLGITDANELSQVENAATALRIAELLKSNSIDKTFDYEHLKAIHRFIFQDVYDWAGEERTAPGTWMTKAGPDVVNFPVGDPNAPMVSYSYFPAGAALSEHANKQFSAIASKNYLRDLTPQTFCTQLAEIWGELNVAHPFREGNTRTQSVFFAQLAEQAGHPIDIGLLAQGQPLRDDFVAARFYCQAKATSTGLATVIQSMLINPPTQKKSIQDLRNDLHNRGLRIVDERRHKPIPPSYGRGR